MPISSRFFIHLTVALTVVAFVALFVIVGMTIWLGERAQVYFNEVIEARDTRSAAVELRSAVQTAESSQRGFILTGNEIYLSPYEVAKTLAQRQLDALKNVLAPHPESLPSLQRLTSILGEKFGEMDNTIKLKRDRKDAEALILVHTNRGKALMDEANVFFSGIIRAADERLTTGVGEQRANAVLLRWASIIAAFVIVVMVGGVTKTVLNYTRDLKTARDEVGLLNTSLEMRVEERTADLAAVNEELQRFAYIVTHDLRAPLVNIMGFTSEVETSINSLQALIDKPEASKDPADPIVKAARVAATVDLPEAIGFIRSSSRKMDNLINAILKLSREGRRTLRRERVDLSEMIKASAASLQHQLSEAGGEISLDIDIPVMRTDKLSLEQILGNLLDNAVKYRSKLRPLHIAVRARQMSDTRIGIQISDNGRGIADQDRERVFDLFRRSGPQDQPGEGIGLAYVRTVVRNLGGEITVTSILDKGTTFNIVLPYEQQDPRSSAS